jgi:hypothetical protein
MRRIPVKATMDSDAWRPFDPVDVKRRVGPRTQRGNNRQGFVEPPSDEDGDDDFAGDFASGYRDNTRLAVRGVTFITLKIDAGA